MNSLLNNTDLTMYDIPLPLERVLVLKKEYRFNAVRWVLSEKLIQGHFIAFSR